jgi:hypothetical protein
MATHTLILHLTAPGTFPGDSTVSLAGTFPLLRHIFTFAYQIYFWHKKGLFKVALRTYLIKALVSAFVEIFTFCTVC